MSHTFSKTIAAIASIVAVSSLGACGVITGSSASTGAGTASNDANAKTITVGVGTVAKPVDYVDENGDLKGYEVDELKAIDDLLPQYRFELKPVDWQNAIVSVDTGKVDFSSNLYGVTAEREKKYLFTKEANLYDKYYVAAPKGDKSITDIEDLAGKKVPAWPGTEITAYLENYNAKNPSKKIDLVYEQLTGDQLKASFKSGALDGTITAYTSYVANPNTYDLVGKPLFDAKIAYLLPKDATELRDDLDGAIKKLRENGTLAKLSQQYFGKDLSEPLTGDGQNA